MNYEYFEKLLSARPFKPFSVQLSSGAIHEIRYPVCAALTRTRLVITDPDADDVDVCSLLHVAKVIIPNGEHADSESVGPAA
jgi:hypothetical protein